jgi:hypothetical protein
LPAIVAINRIRSGRDIFGGLALWIAFVCFLNLWALSNVSADTSNVGTVPVFQPMTSFNFQNSFAFTRVTGFFWSITILLSAIRAIVMILELNKK